MMIIMIIATLLLMLTYDDFSHCNSITINSNQRFYRSSRLTIKCLHMNVNTNDKIDIGNYRKKSSKTNSITVINKTNTKSKANRNIVNIITNPTINTDSLSQYIGLLVLAAKGLTTTRNSTNSNSDGIISNSTYSLSVKKPSTDITIPIISPNDNTAITLLNESPLVFEKFSLDNSGTDVLVEGLWALGALSKKYLKVSTTSNSLDGSNELLSLALRILSHVSDPTHTLSSFQVSMSIISITRIVLATEPNTNAQPISYRYRSSLRVSNTNTNEIINKMLTESVISSSSSQSISNIIWSLGTISCPIPQGTLDQIYDRFALVYKDMNDQAISNILIGLLKAGITWETIPVMVQSILCSGICRECLRMSPQAVCNILYSLGGLGATSNVLTERVILAVELALRKVCIQLKGRDASQALVGLATINIQWNMLSNDTKDRLSIAVLKRANEWTSGRSSSDCGVGIEIVTIISQIVRMKASWFDLTPPLKASILLGLQSFNINNKRVNIKNDDDGNSNNDNDNNNVDEYIKALYYFSLLGLPLKSLPVTVMESILDMIENASSKPLQGISVVLLVKSLSLLQVNWHTDLTNKIRTNILGKVNNVISNASIDVFQLLQEMSTMEVTWVDLSDSLRKTIVLSIDKKIDINNYDTNIDDILASLVSLSVKWSDLPKVVTAKMVAPVNLQGSTVTNKSRARIIRSFGNLGANITDIVHDNPTTDGILDNFLSDMGTNDIIVLLKGLTKCGLKYQSSRYFSAASWAVIINILLPDKDTKMSPKDIASVVLLFGKLGVPVIMERLLTSIGSHVDVMTSKDLTDLMTGLWLLNQTWQRLPSNEKLSMFFNRLMKNILRVIDENSNSNGVTISATNIIKILRCLANLKTDLNTTFNTTTSDFPKIMSGIIQYLTYHNALITANQAESILRSLHQLNDDNDNYDNDNYDSDAKKLVNILLEKVCDFGDINGDSNHDGKNIRQIMKMKPPATLKLFADIGVSLPSVPSTLRTTLLLALVDSLVSAAPRSTREMLVFLRRLTLIRVSASFLPPTAKSVIFMTTARTFMAEGDSKNNRIGFDLLSALSSLGYVWLDLYTISPTLANIIIQSSSTILSSNTNVNIALPRTAIIDMFKYQSKSSSLVSQNVNRLFSLWKHFCIRYNDLDNESKGLVIRISTIAIISSPDDIPVILQVLASLSVKWSEISNRQRNALSIAIGLAVSSLNDYKITEEVIKALIDLEGNWSQFPKELRESLLKQSIDENALKSLQSYQKGE